MLCAVKPINSLETILLMELTDYKVYEFEGELLEFGASSNDMMQVMTTGFSIVVGKYHHLQGLELERFVDLKVLEFLRNGYRPKVAVQESIIELFMDVLRTRLNGGAL